jgi:hypothetical protein
VTPAGGMIVVERQLPQASLLLLLARLLGAQCSAGIAKVPGAAKGSAKELQELPRDRLRAEVVPARLLQASWLRVQCSETKECSMEIWVWMSSEVKKCSLEIWLWMSSEVLAAAGPSCAVVQLPFHVLEQACYCVVQLPFPCAASLPLRCAALFDQLQLVRLFDLLQLPFHVLDCHVIWTVLVVQLPFHVLEHRPSELDIVVIATTAKAT